jgi:hypothetical protein
MPEKQRYPEVSERDDELPLTDRSAKEATERPRPAIQASRAELRGVKVDKAITSVTQSKQRPEGIF